MAGKRVLWVRLWACVLTILLGSAWSAVYGARGLHIVGAEGQAIELYKASYALVIGVSDYQRGWPDLPGVARDILQVQTVLQEQGFDVTVVQDPSKAVLREALENFIHAYGLEPENRLLFYYAGHGHTLRYSYGGEMGYVVPADAPNPHEDRNGFLATAMDMEQIEGYAKRIQSKHAIFLFDSCFSGSIFSLSREAPPKHITYKTSQPVRQFITSGSADETVPDTSIFAQQFLAALQGEADVNGDGYLTGTELGAFLEAKVINYSSGAQHPQYGKIRNPHLDKGDFVFKVTITATPSAAGTQVEVTSQLSTAAALEQRLAALEQQRLQSGGGPDPEAEMWHLVKESNHIDDMRAFLLQYPAGRYAAAAQLKIQQLERQAALPPPAPALLPVSPAPPASPTAPSVAAPPQFSRVQIRELQRQLRQLGLDPGPADGVFGQRTEDALRQYQARRNLSSTGRPDEASLAALDSDVRQQQRTRTEVQVAVGVFPPPPPPPAPAAAGTLRNSIGMEFVRIRAGDFLMGAADGAPDQRPVHQVTISRDFYLGKYEVTQAQWVAVMGSNPSVFKEDRKAGGGMEHVGKEIGGFFRRLGGKDSPQEDAVPQTAAGTPDRPVERVSWMQVQEFILRLNAREGHQKYRLPTEAEWEYAARAGTSGAYGTSKDEAELEQYAWYLPNAAKITHPVGQRRPNAWGLYDIQGNVWEWVQDWWAPTYAAGSSIDPSGSTTGTLRVLRGCSWLNSALQCRLSERGKNAPTVAHVSYGFRLARNIP